MADGDLTEAVIEEFGGAPEFMAPEIVQLRAIVRRLAPSINIPFSGESPASWVATGWYLWSKAEADAVCRALGVTAPSASQEGTDG